MPQPTPAQQLWGSVPSPELQMKLPAARAAAVSGKGSPGIDFCLLTRSLSRFRGALGRLEHHRQGNSKRSVSPPVAAALR